MIPISPRLIALAVVALVIAGLTVALKVQTSRLHAVQDEFSGFKTKVKAEGDAAIAEAKRLQSDREAATRKQEADSAKRYADLDAKYAAARRMLKSGSGSGQAKSLSDAASSLGCPDRQADTAGRLERLEDGILALLERGDRAIERTVTCKAWMEEQAAVR